MLDLFHDAAIIKDQSPYVIEDTMSLSDITVQGYRYNDVAFVAVVEDDQPEKKLNALELRDFGLGGGEIHLSLKDNNRVPGDEGVWYAIKCVRTQEMDDNDRIGTIAIKQMAEDYKELRAISLPLDELDNSHLIDRLISECLHLHADTFGDGPHTTRSPPSHQPRKARV